MASFTKQRAKSKESIATRIDKCCVMHGGTRSFDYLLRAEGAGSSGRRSAGVCGQGVLMVGLSLSGVLLSILR